MLGSTTASIWIYNSKRWDLQQQVLGSTTSSIGIHTSECWDLQQQELGSTTASVRIYNSKYLDLQQQVLGFTAASVGIYSSKCWDLQQQVLESTTASVGIYNSKCWDLQQQVLGSTTASVRIYTRSTLDPNVTPIPKGPPSSSVANYRITSVLSKVFERLVSVRLGRLWNSVVCFQPPSLLIGKVWVPVMHICACPIHCRVHWRVDRRLGSCRSTSVQPLIGSTIWAFSISSVLWVLEVLSCLY